MEKVAVVIVDMLNDFVTGSLKCERAQRIIPCISKLIKEARNNNIPVIYSNDEHLPNIDLELKLWGEHAMKGTKGAEVIPELQPDLSKDYIVPKRRYSGFFQTNLDMLLKELRVDTLIVCGLHAHMCVRHTCADAYMLGYKIIVPTDGVEAFAQEDFDNGVKYLKEVYDAKITTIDDVIKSIKK